MTRLAAFLLVGLLSAPVQASDVFFYETEEGVLSYTDDEKRIPSRYSKTTEIVAFPALEDYERFTPVLKRADKSEVEAEPSPLRTTCSKPDLEAVAFPFSIVRELRWLPGVSGSPGDKYVSVDVLRDGNGREIAVVQSDTGFGPLDVYFQP